MYSAILFLPLIGFLIAGLFGRAIGAKASEYITSGLLILAALLSWITFFGFWLGGSEMQIVDLFRWIDTGDLKVSWSIRVDTLTAVMLIVVTCGPGATPSRPAGIESTSLSLSGYSTSISWL